MRERGREREGEMNGALKQSWEARLKGVQQGAVPGAAEIRQGVRSE